MKRVWLRRISAAAAMALLFAQISVAAYACPHLGKSSGAGANTMAEQDQQPVAGRDAEHTSLCHEHCKAQVSVDRAQVVGVPPAISNGLALPVVDVHRALLPAKCSGLGRAQVNGPPRSILFCVLRT